MKHIEALIADQANSIEIISGEGELGSIEDYTGKRTIRAIKLRLARERCGGDRWARARVYSHEADFGGDVWIDVETGEYA
jgi:hypothetical protein